MRDDDREEFSRNFRKATLRSHEKALIVFENELKPPCTFLGDTQSILRGATLEIMATLNCRCAAGKGMPVPAPS
jgi:hypothetical protein